MDLYLEIIAGQALGTQFKVLGGIKIGRRNCEITIEDPKISSYHATILSRGPSTQLKYYLKDNHSSNGIKFNGQRVPELFLTPGVEFKLGNTVLKVVDLTPVVEVPKPAPAKPVAKKLEKPNEKTTEKPNDRQKAMEKLRAHLKLPNEAKLPPVATPPPTILPAPAPVVEAVVVPPPPTWQESLMTLIENAQLRATDQVQENIAAFNPPLKLKCIRGVQYGKSWLVGYGPRKIGPKSMDLVLTESQAPPICFEVIPTANGGEFLTAHPDIVKYNGAAVERAVLQAGDVVEIFNSQLVVDFDHARN